MQDEFAIESYKRAIAANNNNYFKDEIVEVEIPQKGRDALFVTEDEEYTSVNFDKIPLLKSVFEKNGTITAANASTLNDGASAIVMMSKKKAEALGLKPIARIIGFADAAQAPALFTTAPSLAIPKALKNAGISKHEVDYYEINEAFAAVSIANNIAMNLNPEKVNTFGGAVAMGHPLGNSGARIVCTLLNVLEKKGGKIGVTGICNGGGGASAIVIERM
jgi:acetyl-CoA C-acetyltransferase